MKCLVYLLIGAFACSLVQAYPLFVPRFSPKLADTLNEYVGTENYANDFDGVMKLSKDLVEGRLENKSVKDDKDLFQSLRVFALLEYGSQSCDAHSSIFVITNFKAAETKLNQVMTPDNIVQSTILEALRRHNDHCEPQYKIPNPIPSVEPQLESE